MLVAAAVHAEAPGRAAHQIHFSRAHLSPQGFLTRNNNNNNTTSGLLYRPREPSSEPAQLTFATPVCLLVAVTRREYKYTVYTHSGSTVYVYIYRTRRTHCDGDCRELPHWLAARATLGGRATPPPRTSTRPRNIALDPTHYTLRCVYTAERSAPEAARVQVRGDDQLIASMLSRVG